MVVVLGLGMGIAFGAGAAYGRFSTPKAAAAEPPRVIFQQGQNGAGTSDMQGAAAGMQGRQGMTGGNRPGVVGTVDSVAGNAITVTTTQGTATKVTLNEKTPVQRTVAGSVSDLKAGDRVMVTGERGDDGNVTASAVQILPAAQ